MLRMKHVNMVCTIIVILLSSVHFFGLPYFSQPGNKESKVDTPFIHGDEQIRHIFSVMLPFFSAVSDKSSVTRLWAWFQKTGSQIFKCGPLPASGSRLICCTPGPCSHLCCKFQAH